MFTGRLAKFVAVSTLMGVVLAGAGTVSTGQTTTTTQPKAKVKAKARAKAAASGPLDLNKATAEEMIEQLPGVGEATAKKIVAGRPYATVDDLAKAGVPARTIEGIRGQVTVGQAAAATPRKKAATPGTTPAPATTTTTTTPAPAPTLTTPLDLNKATAEELSAALPGVGEVTAKKIVAGRPYATVDDLAKAGVPARTIEGIRSQVTVGQASAPAAVEPAAKAKMVRKKAATPAPASEPAVTTAGKTARSKAATAPRLAPGQRLNLNTASKAELDVLPGVGPVRAQAIIDNRPYKSIEDVMKVKGIKEINFSKLRDMITVE